MFPPANNHKRMLLVNLDQFSKQVHLAQERAARLTEQFQDSHASELLPEMLKALDVALEELRAADEELRERNSEIEQIHQWAEQERRYYRELFDAAPDAYLVTDTHGIIQDANRAAAVMFHSPQRFLIGKPIALLVADSELRTFRNRMSQLRHTDAPATEAWELEMQPRRSAPVRVTAHISTARDWRGLPAGLRWLLRTRHPLQAAAQASDLHQRIEQQAAQIAALTQRSTDERRQRQALQARLAAAEERLHTHEALISNAAHELRNCVTPICGYADHFRQIGQRQGNVDDRMQRGLRIVAEQGQRIEQIVVALLEWPLIEQGHSAGQAEPLDCALLVAGVVEQMRRALAGVRIQLNRAAAELPIRGDRPRLQQLLSTLIQHAVRRSAGLQPLKLELTQESGWACLTLHDQGPPINDATLQALQRGAQALQCVDVLGVGLAFACVIAARHGGVLQAAAHPGEGNRVTLRLPLDPQPPR